MAHTAPQSYDRIGTGYAGRRRPDPRIARAVNRALGDASTVVNVGAGSGSYEPTDRRVVAVEPAWTMISQRPRAGARAVQGRAEQLPFPTGSFDAALGVLTVHHWSDLRAGLAELQRVAYRQVLFAFEPEIHHDFWLLNDYLPSALDTPVARNAPGIVDLVNGLGGAATSVETVPIPHDCVDGFNWAYWRRPESYLDATTCGAISILAQLPSAELEAGQRSLAADLRSGRWHEKYGHLLDLDTIDGGFRLVVADAAGA